MAAVQPHQPAKTKGPALAGKPEDWDRIDDSDFGPDDEPEVAEASAEACAGSAAEAGGRAFAIADDGSRVRVPLADAYPGKPPFAAPVLGFHAKAAEIFEAFAYLPTNAPRDERPDGFLPVIGLIGDDPAKDNDPTWKLHVRLRPQVWRDLLEQAQGAIDEGGARPGVVVSAMRSEDLALFTISHPQRLFAQIVWMAAMPMGVMKTPLPTIDEGRAHALARAEKARAQVVAQTAQLGRSAQLAFEF